MPFLFLLLCGVNAIVFAQQDASFNFLEVQKLNRQHGFQDPFLKSDGNRVSTREEWSGQREYIKSMLAHYQYGEMPPTPKDVVVKETFSEEFYNGKAVRKLYTLTLKRHGKSLDVHFGLIKPSGEGPFPVIIKNDREIKRLMIEARAQGS